MGQEFESDLTGWFWLRVSYEIVVKMSDRALEACRGLEAPILKRFTSRMLTLSRRPQDLSTLISPGLNVLVI